MSDLRKAVYYIEKAIEYIDDHSDNLAIADPEAADKLQESIEMLEALVSELLDR